MVKTAGCFLVAVACALAGCHSAKMPSPIVFRDGRVDPCARIAEADRTKEVQLFYATSRRPKGSPSRPSYSNDVSQTLRLGVATVQLGGDDMTWEQLCAASTGKVSLEKLPMKITAMREVARLPKPSQPPTTDEEVIADQLAWADAIDRQLDHTPNKQVNVYVHGCNTDLEPELLMAAPFFHFVGRSGAMIVFDWPSRQTIFLYGSDAKRARGAAPQLIRLLEFLTRNTRAERINILAYSAGGGVMNQALIDLRESHRDWDEARLQRELRIGNVVFAGSDLDLKGFATDDLTRFLDLPSDVTVYISNQDFALKLASFLSPPKLGNPKQKALTKAQLERLANIEKLHVIDVTSVPGTHTSGGFMGHGYWYANEWVMSDVLATFRWNLSPPQRGLDRTSSGKWMFPSDYPQRITQAVVDWARREHGPPSTATQPTATPPPTSTEQSSSLRSSRYPCVPYLCVRGRQPPRAVTSRI
jgi:esterase/lipase superfamily enzyme